MQITTEPLVNTTHIVNSTTNYTAYDEDNFVLVVWNRHFGLFSVSRSLVDAGVAETPEESSSESVPL